MTSYNSNGYLESLEPAARITQLIALFKLLDERGQLTTLALLATAAKLHPRNPA